jgi:uncharacterized protein
MARRAIYVVTVNGRDITSTLAPLLHAASVSLRSGGQGDAASLILDDTQGQIEMPSIGAAISIAFGWESEGARVVFEGTVDETRSSASRASGRLLSITARGFDSAGAAKGRLRKHWDSSSVQTILGDAAGLAGIDQVQVDPDLADITLTYWAMSDESFLHMGQRLAERIGGNFRIQRGVAIMARRGAQYAPETIARHGENLHGWDVAPVLGRRLFRTVIAPFYDQVAGRWDKVAVETGLPSDADLTISPPADDREDASRQANAQAEASKRAAGGGSVTIEGDPNSTPDGRCRIVGARAGINGSYRIISVNHTLSRGGGFVTAVEIGHPDALITDEDEGTA